MRSFAYRRLVYCCSVQCFNEITCLLWLRVHDTIVFKCFGLTIFNVDLSLTVELSLLLAIF